MRRGSVITPTPPSSPKPTLSDGGDSGQRVLQRELSVYPDLDLSQDSEYDIVFATEHNSCFLHTSRSLESTLPIPEQERLDWETRQSLPAREYPAGTRSRAYEPGSPRDLPCPTSRHRSWSSPEDCDYFLNVRPQIIISATSSPFLQRRTLEPSASSTFSGENNNLFELSIPPPTIPRVPLPPPSPSLPAVP